VEAVEHSTKEEAEAAGVGEDTEDLYIIEKL
jgi:hypothetical protein